jgi:hypothetical protein
VDTLVVGGKIVVHEGHLLGLDLPTLIDRHNGASRRLLDG